MISFHVCQRWTLCFGSSGVRILRAKLPVIVFTHFLWETLVVEDDSAFTAAQR